MESTRTKMERRLDKRSIERPATRWIDYLKKMANSGKMRVTPLEILGYVYGYTHTL